MPRWSSFIPYPVANGPISQETGIPAGATAKQIAFALLDDREVLFGGAAGPGKSEALLQVATQDVDDFPVSALLLRRTFKELDKPGGLMHRAREWFAGTRAHWDGLNFRWVFPSGASLSFGYLDHEGDELKYQSSEYQMVGFDELTHFPEHQYLYLFSRLRRLRDSTVPLRMRGATNPGGPGHEWVRKRFNLPSGQNLPPGRVFIGAHMTDNPFLDQESYLLGLSELGEVTRAQLLGGDWTAASTGGYFQTDKFIIVPWDEVPSGRNFQAILRYWDFGATEKTESNPDPDYTAGLKIGMTVPRVRPDRDLGNFADPSIPMPDWYIFDVVRARKDPGGVERLIRQTALKDGRNIPQWVEQERGSAGKTVYHHYNTNVLPEFNVRKLYATGDKETRAKIAASRTAERRVFLVQGPYIPDFLAECGAFGIPGVHDDQIDAFSNGIISLEKEQMLVGAGRVDEVKKFKSTMGKPQLSRSSSTLRSVGYP